MVYPSSRVSHSAVETQRVFYPYDHVARAQSRCFVPQQHGAWFNKAEKKIRYMYLVCVGSSHSNSSEKAWDLRAINRCQPKAHPQRGPRENTPWAGGWGFVSACPPPHTYLRRAGLRQKGVLDRLSQPEGFRRPRDAIPTLSQHGFLIPATPKQNQPVPHIRKLAGRTVWDLRRQYKHQRNTGLGLVHMQQQSPWN